MVCPRPRFRPSFLLVLLVGVLAPAALAETPEAAAPGLTGVARDPGGVALQEVEVRVVQLVDPLRPERVTTDKAGRFVVPGLVPGLYRVTASVMAAGALSAKKRSRSSTSCPAARRAAATVAAPRGATG